MSKPSRILRIERALQAADPHETLLLLAGELKAEGVSQQELYDLFNAQRLRLEHMFHPLTPEDFGVLIYLKVHFVRVGRLLGPIVALAGALLVVFRGAVKVGGPGASLWPSRRQGAM